MKQSSAIIILHMVLSHHTLLCITQFSAVSEAHIMAPLNSKFYQEKDFVLWTPLSQVPCSVCGTQQVLNKYQMKE